jgi:hypothetical protein
MKNLFNYMKILFLSILFISCNDSLGVDDNDKETGDWSTYTRLNLGDYMVFDEYIVNQNHEDILYSKSCKSEVIDTNTYHDNKKSSYTKTTTSNGSDKHELYAYLEGSKLYISRKTLAINVLRFSPCELIKGDDFILWVDFEKENWPCDYIEMNESIGNDVYFNGVINIFGKMIEDTIIKIGNIDYNCKVSVITTSIIGTFTRYSETFTLAEPYVITYTSYIAKNGGIIHAVVDMPEFHGCDWFGTNFRKYIGYKYIATEVYKK